MSMSEDVIEQLDRLDYAAECAGIGGLGVQVPTAESGRPRSSSGCREPECQLIARWYVAKSK